MKIDQIRYVIEIYNTGSITKAAKKLFISQPNISHAVKKLELELGFNILIRNNYGVTFTDKGIEFVRHGRYIIEHLEQISNLSTDEQIYTFSLVAPWYPPAEYAYYKLCLEYENQPKVRFSFRNANQTEAMAMLNENSCDIALIVSNASARQPIAAEADNKNFKYVKLNTLQGNVNLAANHPLLAENQFELIKLWNYPYVKYRDMNFNESSYDLYFVNPQKIIMADSRELRSLIVTNSSAYSIGMPLPPQRISELNWHSEPIPGGIMDFGYIIPKNRTLSEAAKRYLELLKLELVFLDENHD